MAARVTVRPGRSGATTTASRHEGFSTNAAIVIRQEAASHTFYDFGREAEFDERLSPSRAPYIKRDSYTSPKMHDDVSRRRRDDASYFSHATTSLDARDRRLSASRTARPVDIFYNATPFTTHALVVTSGRRIGPRHFRPASFLCHVTKVNEICHLFMLSEAQRIRRQHLPAAAIRLPRLVFPA